MFIRREHLAAIILAVGSGMGLLPCTLGYVNACIALTYTGSAPVIIALLILMIKMRGYRWLRLSIGLLSASVVNSMLKIIIGSPRPPIEEWIIQAEGPGFPSGHAAITSAFWITVYMDVRSEALFLAGLIHVIGVSMSRVKLGVHYPIDVLGGVLQGFLTAYITLELMNKIKVKNIDYYIILVLLLISLVLFYINPLLKTPLILLATSILLLILLYKLK